MNIEKENLNYIDKLVNEDIKNKVYTNIITRFPPEPNGFLHIGSAFAINISYQIAQKHHGKFNLRFDDTNPQKEDIKYVEAIKDDMRFLGIDYNEFYGSDYNEQIFNYALYLIKKGKAFVCDLSSEEIKAYRGTLTEKGKESPYRNRTIEENIDLFTRMKNKEFIEGSRVLRAKIDMTSSNINMRDPVIYRISYRPHYRTGSKWCIYPMYDFAHPIQDYIEGVTHSLCSIEFKNHRPLYEWVLNELDLHGPIPRQIEFGRMGVSGVVTSKRYLRALVNNHIVDGWDDPRMPTIKGLQRRGYTKDSIINFLREIGISKGESIVDVSMLENSIRQDIKTKVNVIMAIKDPLKVVITNLDNDCIEYLNVINNKENINLGFREIPFTNTIFIERNDFSLNPPKNYKRLILGGEVRLMHAYFIKCNEVIKDKDGKVVELRCTYDPKTKSGSGFNERKVKGTIHWISSINALPCEIRVFEQLFNEVPNKNNLFEVINKNSLKIYMNALVEKSIININDEHRYQFIRNGFYIKDFKLSNHNKLVFNQTVALKSSYK